MERKFVIARKYTLQQEMITILMIILNHKSMIRFDLQKIFYQKT